MGSAQVCILQNSWQLLEEELDRDKSEGRETTAEGNLGGLT